MNNDFSFFVPAQAVGASKVFFDLFNADLAQDYYVKLMSLRPLVSGAVAVVGVLAVDLFLTRTTTIGTGGTAFTSEGATLTAATISKLDTTTLPANITGRNAPGGGAAAGALLNAHSLFSEETSNASYIDKEFVHSDSGGIMIPTGTGIRVVQGTVASVGNIGFVGLIRLFPK
jgi:hypothetical protein